MILFDNSTVSFIANRNMEIAPRINLWCLKVIDLHLVWVDRATSPEDWDDQKKIELDYDLATAEKALIELYFECSPAKCYDPNKNQFQELLFDTIGEFRREFIIIDKFLKREGGLYEKSLPKPKTVFVS